MMAHLPTAGRDFKKDYRDFQRSLKSLKRFALSVYRGREPGGSMMTLNERFVAILRLSRSRAFVCSMELTVIPGLGSALSVMTSIRPLLFTTISNSSTSWNSFLSTSSTVFGEKSTPRTLRRSSVLPTTSLIFLEVLPQEQEFLPLITRSFVLKRIRGKDLLPRGGTTATPLSPSSTSFWSVSRSRISTKKKGSMICIPSLASHIPAQAQGSVPPMWSKT